VTARDVFDRPADRLLAALRATGSDAYRCDPARSDRWHAFCPACEGRGLGERRLTITEHTLGGAVTITCAAGCDVDAVYAALVEGERAFDAGENDFALECRAVAAIADRDLSLVRSRRAQARREAA
jgi:hypothetical protein